MSQDIMIEDGHGNVDIGRNYCLYISVHMVVRISLVYILVLYNKTDI